MQSKSAFFATTNYSIDNFDSTFRKLVLGAYAKRLNSATDAKLYLAICGVDLESTVKILLTMEKNNLLNIPLKQAIFSPVGCGDIANAFCTLITGDAMIISKKETHSLASLDEELENDLPKVVRIDIPGHSYVMVACEKTSHGVWGYVYQSNVAYQMEDNSFSLAAWLMDAKSFKTNLSEHLRKLARLLNPSVSNLEKELIYLELYSAQPIVEVKVPANMKEMISYINENLFFKYKTQAVSVQDMLFIAERIRNIIIQNADEQEQSLDVYISNMQEELEACRESEYKTVMDPL
ncbi:hypothetical protein [Legionella sp. WA2022007384]